MIRCDPNDPKRCQGVGKNGQCPYRAMENSCFCERHGGNRAQEKIKKEKLRLYRLQRWENRKNEFADHQKIKSLREEIGILRMILEETLNRCQKSHDLLIYNQKISDLILKIEKIVSSANKLERALGETMDKASLLSIIDQIIQIITKYVDQEKLKLIAQEIDDRIN